MTDYILEMKSIVKEFGPVRALDNVNLQVKKGEIHAICGENGAGKSTLMNVLSGVYPYGTYSGKIIYKGSERKFSNLKDSEKVGIAIIHQELTLIPLLSIRENIFLGNEMEKHGVINRSESYKKAISLMKEVGLEESPNTPVINIGVGKQQLVEICKALSKNCDLLILDEPTASLNDIESDNLLNLLLEFKKKGMTCILISHKLNEVRKVADSITVIRDGSTIDTMSVEDGEITEDRIISSMVGREMTNRFPERTPHIGDVLFEVKDWTIEHPQIPSRLVSDHISLHVNKGEVVGIAGLMGAGRTEFAMSVFGGVYGKYISGEIYKNGKKRFYKTPKQAIDDGVAYVTEDRKDSGLVLIEDLKENMSMAVLDRFSRHGVTEQKKIFRESERMRKALSIKTPNVFEKIENLSGGNQQKVMLAKWILAEPDVLILDEPTRGVDVGAKYEIYCIINDLVSQGKGVIMISSEMEEVIGLSDRIYVLAEGSIRGEFTRDEVTQEKIMSSIIREDQA
ncbi:MAG: ATP-binding cassette domain-containing protein [Bilifractor sp.]|jgi:putative multiple sugar transport system ATP-binding protein